MVAVATALLAVACGTGPAEVEGTRAPADGTPSTALTRLRRAMGVERPAWARGVALPVGTVLHLRLSGAVGSDSSRVEDAVSAEVTQPVLVNGREVIPVGATVSGLVSEADEGGRVKGRARVGLRFTALRSAGVDYEMQTSGFARTAAATKSEDATKIGVGAGIGAAVGGILGGKKGAAEGAAIGGGAGTGVVLATRGEAVRLASGTVFSTRLTAPLTVQVAQ